MGRELELSHTCALVALKPVYEFHFLSIVSANLHGLMVGLVEKPLLRAVMRETKGNQVRAAQLLGINRNTLRKKLKEHGIDPDVA